MAIEIPFFYNLIMRKAIDVSRLAYYSILSSPSHSFVNYCKDIGKFLCELLERYWQLYLIDADSQVAQS